ncbi:MAG TPA: glycine zipper 2TM domain-containing protein [Gemmatimonadales bacterium]|nr:glycine zipper 2TM domain-containing protein [Gemmatimonadales bacterium]
MKHLIPVGIALLGACGSGALPFAGAGKDEAVLTLGSGAVVEATTERAISSRSEKAGGTFTARVSKPVKDAEGLVVIPAGSTLHLTITELQPANDKSAADGKVSVVLSAVTVGGKQFPVSGDVTSMAHVLKGRGVGTTEVGKTAAGAVVGGVAGRVIGGNATGTVIGAVVGGAAGAAVAVETANRDVVVAAGTPIMVTLRGPVTISFR